MRRLSVLTLDAPLSVIFLCLTAVASVLTIDNRGSITSMAVRTVKKTSILLAVSAMSNKASGSAMQVAVLPASNLSLVAPAGAMIDIQTRFEARYPLPEDDTLILFILNARGIEVARVQNDLKNGLTFLPTSSWAGPISLLTPMRIPALPDGIYSIRLSLYKPAGPLKLSPGIGVTVDDRYRYSIGTIRIDSSAQPPTPLPPVTLDLTGYHLSFDEPFTSMSISDSKVNDGARWYARNEECCMATTDATSTSMAGRDSPHGPFSLIPGGGLNIRLQRVSNSWTSGVLTSVDSVGSGFSQQYGYFEMKAKLPSGLNTWPAFWLLNTDSKKGRSPPGEIDVVEYIANPGFSDYIATTLHDWSDKSVPAMSHHRVPLPSDGFHTYGMLWTETTMTFYFDGSITLQAPTPSIMKQPYYLLVDLGIGGGWPTTETPATNDLQIQYIRAYSK